MRRFRATYLLTGMLLLHGPVSGASHDACVRSGVANRYRRCKSNPLERCCIRNHGNTAVTFSDFSHVNACQYVIIHTYKCLVLPPTHKSGIFDVLIAL